MARHRPPTFAQDLHDVLAGPLIHQLAEDLAGCFPRRRRHPIALHLGFLALQRSAGSANALDAELAAPGMWRLTVDTYNRGATLHGDGLTVGRYLPILTSDTFRHLRDTLTEPDNLDTLLDAHIRRSVILATAVGLLPDRGGSLTHPDPRRTLYGDGTIVRPLYRPDTPGRIDPDIAQHVRHDGPHWGNNFVLAYCRGPAPHQRVILGAARVDDPGREADTAVALFDRIIAQAGSRIQAVVYDGALRGVHHNQLMRDRGVLVITKVHAASRRDGIKTARTRPLGTRAHHLDEQRCVHTLVIHDGAIHEAVIDAAGDLQLTAPLVRQQVRRTRSQAGGYRFALGVIIACPRQPFTVWISPHPHADQLRLLPESDDGFAKLYGLRNDAESNNNSYKRTLPGRRAVGLGWRRQLLDVTGWATLVNSRAYARHGPPLPATVQVEPPPALRSGPAGAPSATVTPTPARHPPARQPSWERRWLGQLGRLIAAWAFPSARARHRVPDEAPPP